MNTASAQINNDTWVYDQQHPGGLNTLKGDENFKPPESDLPVSEQRRMSNTAHKYERPSTMVSLTPEDAGQNAETVLQRRRSSVSANKTTGRRPSRKATGSYGDGTVKPLSSLTAEEKEKVLNSTSNPLYFTEALPSTAH